MRTISPAQQAFVSRLVSERDASAFDPILTARVDEARIGSLPLREASALIDSLKAQPRADLRVRPTLTEAGIFVTEDGTAIKVVKSRESGRFYTKTLVFHTHEGVMTMDWAYTPGLSVEGLRRMPDTMAAEVGLQCNQCVSCLAPLGGATVSAKVSAVIGYGATCAEGNQWAYPKGVRAQRAFLAEHGVTV